MDGITDSKCFYCCTPTQIYCCNCNRPICSNCGHITLDEQLCKDCLVLQEQAFGLSALKAIPPSIRWSDFIIYLSLALILVSFAIFLVASILPLPLGFESIALGILVVVLLFLSAWSLAHLRSLHQPISKRRPGYFRAAGTLSGTLFGALVASLALDQLLVETIFAALVGSLPAVIYVTKR